RGSQRFSAYVRGPGGATPIRRLFSEFAGPCFAFRTFPLRRSRAALHAGWLPTSGLYLDRRPLSVVEKLLRSGGRLTSSRRPTFDDRPFCYFGVTFRESSRDE